MRRALLLIISIAAGILWLSIPRAEEPLPVECDCKAAVAETVDNCIEAYAAVTQECDDILHEVYTGLEACVVLEDTYGEIEETTSKEDWDKTMEVLKDAQRHQVDVFLKYYDYYSKEHYHAR